MIWSFLFVSFSTMFGRTAASVFKLRRLQGLPLVCLFVCLFVCYFVICLCVRYLLLVSWCCLIFYLFGVVCYLLFVVFFLLQRKKRLCLAGIPSLFRLLQCLRRYRDSGFKDSGHMLNAAKFTSVLIVVNLNGIGYGIAFLFRFSEQ
jgi:hypothetical protein